MRLHGPRLRPGVHVLRRDDGHVQVGLDPPGRVVLPADPAVLAVLEQLGAGVLPLDADDPSGTLAALAANGLLETDPTSPAPVAGTPGTPGKKGTPATRRVVRLGLGGEPLDLTLLADLLADAGVRSARSTYPPDVHLVASRGPLPRSRVDALLGEGAPHLLLTGTGRPGSLRLGPFVQPGVTACLRCLDAHEVALDPRRPLLVEQLARLPAAPIDPAVLALAQTWAARDLATYLAGGRPSTWSATVDLDAEVPEVRPWRRHPWCGCAWDVVPF